MNNEDCNENISYPEYALEDSGIIEGNITFDALDDRDLSETPVGDRPTLRQGDSGPWVEELQRELTQLTFYSGLINGTFDAATAAAVRAFQTNNKITADGVVGRETWSALVFLYAPLARCPNSGLIPVPFKGVVIDAGQQGIGVPQV